MKLTLDYIFKKISDMIFNAITLFVILICALGFVFFRAYQIGETRIEELREVTEYCYSQGMVVVRTDVGERCSDPRSLVKAK